MLAEPDLYGSTSPPTQVPAVILCAEHHLSFEIKGLRCQQGPLKSAS